MYDPAGQGLTSNDDTVSQSLYIPPYSGGVPSRDYWNGLLEDGLGDGGRHGNERSDVDIQGLSLRADGPSVGIQDGMHTPRDHGVRDGRALLARRSRDSEIQNVATTPDEEAIYRRHTQLAVNYTTAHAQNHAQALNNPGHHWERAAAAGALTMPAGQSSFSEVTVGRYDMTIGGQLPAWNVGGPQEGANESALAYAGNRQAISNRAHQEVAAMNDHGEYTVTVVPPDLFYTIPHGFLGDVLTNLQGPHQGLTFSQDSASYSPSRASSVSLSSHSPLFPPAASPTSCGRTSATSSPTIPSQHPPSIIPFPSLRRGRLREVQSGSAGQHETTQEKAAVETTKGYPTQGGSSIPHVRHTPYPRSSPVNGADPNFNRRYNEHMCFPIPTPTHAQFPSEYPTAMMAPLHTHSRQYAAPNPTHNAVLAGQVGVPASAQTMDPQHNAFTDYPVGIIPPSPLAHPHRSTVGTTAYADLVLQGGMMVSPPNHQVYAPAYQTKAAMAPIPFHPPVHSAPTTAAYSPSQGTSDRSRAPPTSTPGSVGAPARVARTRVRAKSHQRGKPKGTTRKRDGAFVNYTLDP